MTKSKSNYKKRVFKSQDSSRNGPRRKVTTRRQDENVLQFWNKVIEGFKKLLSPAFKE
jgi:hypothetical protein